MSAYVHQSFPKWVYRGSESRLVQNADQLADLGEEWGDVPGYSMPAPESKDEDLRAIEAAELEEAPVLSREELLEKAKAQGLKVDGRWSVARLQAALNGQD